MRYARFSNKTCVAMLASVVACPLALAQNPITGTWYNSYCSRIDLEVGKNREIQGTYTSHTGSTGTSRVMGVAGVQPTAATNITYVGSEDVKGVPFSMGVQWRLINVDQSRADGTWHWVSSFSGQYHPAQTVTVPDQKPYSIDETLVILNGLIATATTPGLANSAPLFWPQSLTFHRDAPSYCEPVTPAPPVKYTPTAEDMVSGVWIDAENNQLKLDANLSSGVVSGSYVSHDGVEYKVIGLFDTLGPPSMSDTESYEVVAQGLTLALYQSDNSELRMLAGGVSSPDYNSMFLFSSNLQATTWIDRFIQGNLDKSNWTRKSPLN